MSFLREQIRAILKDAYGNDYIRSKPAVWLSELSVLSSKKQNERRVIFLRGDNSIQFVTCLLILFVGLKEISDGSWSVSSYSMVRLGNLLISLLQRLN